VPGILALTGATGFIGGRVLARALQAGWRVRALARRPAALAPHPALTAVPGDLESAEARAVLLQGAEAVVHAAGLVAARRRSEFARVNAEAATALAEAAAGEPTAPRFLLISSLAAREPALSPYARSKHEAEARLRALGQRLNSTVLRPPVVYGPGDRATLPLFRQFRRGLLLHPPGGGRFSMIHVDDLTEAILAWLEAAAVPLGPLEVDDGQPSGYGWEDVLAVARRRVNRRLRAVAVPAAAMRLAALAIAGGALLTGRPAFLSQGKISEALHPDWVSRREGNDALPGWRPRIGLDEGFARTMAWYTANRWL
jgi:nucleoside-diphosphate-sugar epimerase